jgi:sec-independent protein translocase protein TatB
VFDIGLQELLVILVIALLVFGPQRLPELGRMLGRALREFRRASDEFRSTVETNLRIDDPEPVPEPVIPPESTLRADRGPTPADPSLLGSPAVSGVETTEGHTSEPSLEPFCAKRGARLVHRWDCLWAARIREAERVGFSRLIDAQDQALVNCPVCEPVEVRESGAKLAESSVTT